MYLRLNPRTHTPFGLGRLEVAFETVNQFLSANRYAGRLASNSVVQYALWLNEATPEQHDRLIRWWQDEIEGTGRVPLLSCEQKPEVLRFAGGTDADLRIQWQEFLLTHDRQRIRAAANAAGAAGRRQPLHRRRDGRRGVSMRGRAGRQACWRNTSRAICSPRNWAGASSSSSSTTWRRATRWKRCRSRPNC